MKWLVNILAFVLAASSFAATTNHTSNAVTVKGWKREILTWNTSSNAFSRSEFPTLAEATAAAQVAAEIPAVYVAATNSIITNLAPIHVATTNHLAKTIVAMTGAASLDNLLDRDNLTMAVVSNVVTKNANGTRSVRSWVASNKTTKSAPVMKARIKTINGDDEWLEPKWADGYTNSIPLRFSHPQSYTNFVVAVTTNEIPVVTTNYILVVEGVTTNTTTMILTNQVLAVFDGAQAIIVRSGDAETLYCHELTYTLPATAVPPDISRWVKVGDPDAGFDFGNRRLRVNGAMTVTTNDLNFLGDFMVYTNDVPVSVTNDFTFFADNGLLKVTEKSTNTVSGVNL